MSYDQQPIPVINDFKWEEVRKIRIEECGEPLVPLGLIPEKILINPQYYIQQIRGALPDCYIREGNLTRLIGIANKLPPGYRLLIFDAWRPGQVQNSLYMQFYQELKRKFPTKKQRELEELAERFIAPPSSAPDFPSPHLTGGAIDLTIVDDQGKMLNMGTGFDQTDQKALTSYYEELLIKGELSSEEKEILDNRRLLYHLMSRAGFTNYPLEWWHYDFGNQNWAWMHQDSRDACYGGSSPYFRWRDDDLNQATEKDYISEIK
ncbi:MAG: M15 family metallopeptidase [Halanaerobiales bacterium]|nr:M15 family metallopeptidase [Halanaerobiales bacterium]